MEHLYSEIFSVRAELNFLPTPPNKQNQNINNSSAIAFYSSVADIPWTIRFDFSVIYDVIWLRSCLKGFSLEQIGLIS